MITQESINEVKQRTEILDVIGRYISISKKGAEHVAKCPFHDEKTPSFKVSKPKQIYKCFGCGKSGDAISFVMEFKQVKYLEAIQEIARFYNITLEKETDQKKSYSRPEKREPAIYPQHLEYMRSRGINEQTLFLNKVTSCREWMPKAQGVTDALCFNYYRDGELINIKYRADNKDFKLHKDAELIFYNIDAIKGKDSVIIVEGEIDCLTLLECGLQSVISVPNGAGKNQKLEYLDNCWQLLDNLKQVILFTDNDEAGNALRNELARRLGYERCLKVVFPAECKDANEIFLKHGKAALLQCIANSVEFPVEGVIGIDDVLEDVAEFYINGYPKGVKVGRPELDEYISFIAGQFTTITGMPGSGKSEFLDDMACNLAVNHNWSFAVCSFENQPTSFHITKLMEKIVGKSFAFRYDTSSRINIDEFSNVVPFVRSHFHFINMNEVDISVDGLLAKIGELVKRKGIQAAIIDPWNYIEHKIPLGYTETQYISESLTKIKAACLKYGIHIFLVAHPKKLAKTDANTYEVPTMYSISGSAHFFNKTDNGITVYRNFNTNLVDIHVQKIRYSWLGKLGFCSFQYNTETRQYQSVNA